MYQVDFTSMYLGFKNQHRSRLGKTKFGYIDLISNNHEFIEYEITQEDIEKENDDKAKLRLIKQLEEK